MTRPRPATLTHGPGNPDWEDPAPDEHHKIAVFTAGLTAAVVWLASQVTDQGVTHSAITRFDMQVSDLTVCFLH